MMIAAILFVVGAFGELYVALNEPSRWGTLFVTPVLVFLSDAAARMAVAEAAAVNAMASGSQHSAMRALSRRIARSLSVWRRAQSRRSGAALVPTWRP
jgi:hypothetical protein